jgi:hypothetical protein
LKRKDTFSVLYVPDELHLQKIDDEDVPNSVHNTPKKGYRIEFEPGDHTLILYYYRFTNNDDKIGRVINGNPLCVFFRIEAGHAYSLFYSCEWQEDTFDCTIGMEDMISKEPMLILSFPAEVE